MLNWQKNRSRRRTQTLTATAEVQPLETRALLAGNVIVSVQDGDVLIKGDRRANSVTITTIGNGVQILGTNRTRINNSPFMLIPNTSIQNLDVRMKGGNDVVVLVSNVSGNLSAKMGSGSDVLQVTSTIDGNLGVKTGSSIPDSADVVAIAASSIGGSANIKGAGGRQEVTVNASTFVGQTTVSLGGGNDLFEVSTTSFGALDANGGGGSKDWFVYAPLVDLPSRNFERVF